MASRLLIVWISWLGCTDLSAPLIHHPPLAVLDVDLASMLDVVLVDPTLPVIASTYAIALMVAACAMILRRARRSRATSGVGLVEAGYFRPLDLVGAGWIFAIYVWLSLGQIAAAGIIETQREIGMLDLWVSIGFQCVMVGMVLLVMAPRVRAVDWLGLRWAGWKALFFLAPLSVVGMWLVFGMLEMAGFTRWLESLGVDTVQDSVRALKQQDDFAFLLLMRFSAVVVAPVCEEVIFRGYLYGVAKRYCGPVGGAICSALVFSAAHASLVALLPLALFGLLLVWLYERTGSLWAPIIVHACFNAATVMVLMAQ